MSSSGRFPVLSGSILCFFIFILISLAATAPAQDASTGAIRGTVADAAGSRVAGAIVVFVDAATGFR
jgi:hypothetical protein